MSDTFDPIAFLSAVSGDGDWPDEFLAWYEPGKWLSDERACAAFIADKHLAMAAALDALQAEGSTVRIYPPEFAKMPAGPMCEAMTREQLWQYAMLCGYRTQLSEQDSRPQPATGAADASGYTDARRYRAFIAAGLPVCFLGVEYHTQAELDAAIDGSINQ